MSSSFHITLWLSTSQNNTHKLYSPSSSGTKLSAVNKLPCWRRWEKKLYLCAINFCLAGHLCAQTPHKEHVAAGNGSEKRKQERTRAKEDQAGLKSLQLNLGIKVMKLHGAEDLVHGHGQLIQTGGPTNTGRLVSKLVRNTKCSPQCVWIFSS